jgi:hypothetical protein
VCVSVDARREWARKDAIGEMVRKTQCVTITANGKTSVITADGKKLGDVMWINERLRMNSLKKILAAWEALPEEERKPGRKVDYGPPDPCTCLMHVDGMGDHLYTWHLRGQACLSCGAFVANF